MKVSNMDEKFNKEIDILKKKRKKSRNAANLRLNKSSKSKESIISRSEQTEERISVIKDKIVKILQ
jgi:hypothetical protein